jgi:hypothetical protein
MDRESWKFAGLVAAVLALAACNSMSGPHRPDANARSTYTYPRESIPFAPPGYATPDKLEGNQQPAVTGPTS